MVNIIASSLIAVLIWLTDGKENSITKAEYQITLADGFEQDIVSIVLNADTVISNIEITSEFSTGLSGVRLEYDNEELVSFIRGKEIRTSYTFSNILRIQIIINNLPYGFTVDLKDGKYIVISKHKYFFNVYCNQYKKKPYFE